MKKEEFLRSVKGKMAYRFDTLSSLALLIYDYETKEDFPFTFFEDNGDTPDGNALIVLEEDTDQTLRDLCKKYDIKPVRALVFPNKELADEQAYDGGITCYYTSRDQFIVLV